MAKIQIFSVLGRNGILFAKLLRHTMLVLSSGRNELEFKCFLNCDPNPPKGWHALECITKQKHTSLNHATGMNRALDYIDGDYVIFADSDVAILAPNWDEYLIKRIEQENIDILGIGHHNSSGYQNFPIVTFFIAKSLSHLRAKPDMRPVLVPTPGWQGFGAKMTTITTERGASIYEKPIGSDLVLDSGWRMPYAYKTAGMRGAIFTPGKPYTIPNVPQIWEFDGILGICHKGKGSKRGNLDIVQNFIKSVEDYIATSLFCV